MKKIETIKELQEIELDIVKYVDQICRENGLTYFLAYGTLIGAVRHKGFIPWDDDVDILMPREDYKKFCDILYRSDGKYKILCCEYDKDYMYAFGKVIDSRTLLIEQGTTSTYRMGVYIDVFPYDGIKGDVRKNILFLKSCAFLEKCRYFSTSPYKAIGHETWWKNILRIPFWVFLKGVNYRNIVKLLNHLIKKYPVKGAKWVGCLCAQEIEKELVPAAAVSKAVDMEFENVKLLCPAGYDRMLRTMYGDYMELPPVHKRISHHDFKAWWIEEE